MAGSSQPFGKRKASAYPAAEPRTGAVEEIMRPRNDSAAQAQDPFATTQVQPANPQNQRAASQDPPADPRDQFAGPQDQHASPWNAARLPIAHTRLQFFPFGNLPRELRDRVYSHLLPGRIPRQQWQDRAFQIPINIFLVCRQMKKEVEECFYRENTFVFVAHTISDNVFGRNTKVPSVRLGVPLISASRLQHADPNARRYEYYPTLRRYSLSVRFTYAPPGHKLTTECGVFLAEDLDGYCFLLSMILLRILNVLPRISLGTNGAASMMGKEPGGRRPFPFPKIDLEFRHNEHRPMDSRLQSTLLSSFHYLAGNSIKLTFRGDIFNRAEIDKLEALLGLSLFCDTSWTWREFDELELSSGNIDKHAQCNELASALKGCKNLFKSLEQRTCSEGLDRFSAAKSDDERFYIQRTSRMFFIDVCLTYAYLSLKAADVFCFIEKVSLLLTRVSMFERSDRYDGFDMPAQMRSCIQHVHILASAMTFWFYGDPKATPMTVSECISHLLASDDYFQKYDAQLLLYWDQRGKCAAFTEFLPPWLSSVARFPPRVVNFRSLDTKSGRPKHIVGPIDMKIVQGLTKAAKEHINAMQRSKKLRVTNFDALLDEYKEVSLENAASDG